MKRFIRELGEFAMQRSIADVALGLIIGAALGDFVKVLVEEIILPPISFFTQGMNLENRSVLLREAGSIDGAIPMEDIAIGYGKLIEVSVEFAIIGLALFFVVKSSRALWWRTRTLQHDEEQKIELKENELLQHMIILLEKQNDLLAEQQKRSSSRSNIQAD